MLTKSVCNSYIQFFHPILSLAGITLVSSLAEDMGLPETDSWHTQRGKRNAFLEHFRVTDEGVAYLKVAHGIAIHNVVSGGLYAGDGLIAKSRIMPHFGLFSADCLPVLVLRNIGRMIVQRALLHCGWRGITGYNLSAPLHRELLHNTWQLPRKDKRLADTHWFIGPSICKECYLVADPVQLQREDTKQAWLPFMKMKDSKVPLYSVDLAGFFTSQLIDYGVPADNIVNVEECTFHKHHYPSYQRGDKSKRLLTLVCPFLK